MSPNTPKYRTAPPLTERRIVVHQITGDLVRHCVTYRNPKRAAGKADWEARRVARRVWARKAKQYRGPRVVDSQWADVHAYKVLAAAAERATAAAEDSLRAVAAAAGRLEEQRLLREFGVGR